MTGKNLPMTVCVPLCKLLTLLLIAALFLALPTAAYAEEITYTGDKKQLKEAPAWLKKNLENALFPSTKNTPLSSGNKVTINYDQDVPGVSNPEVVYGGLSESKQSENNSVVLINGKVVKNIFGGVSHKDDTKGNSVTINSGSVGGGVVGGLSSDGNATNNTVIINKAAIGDMAIGGFSEEGAAEGNKITVNGGSMDSYVLGGHSLYGIAAGNTATISGGSVGKVISGGKSHNGDAVNNTVTVSGGEVDMGVIGGYGLYGVASGNMVTVSGGVVNGRILGGLGARNATNNTITITGRPNLVKTMIFGGFNGKEFGDAVTGNTLNFKSSGLSAVSVNNFEYYNFYLPQDLVAGGVMLSVTEAVNLGGTTVTISLQGTNLSNGDKIALIHSAEGIRSAPKNKSGKANHGGVLYEFSIYTDKNNLWAKVTKVSNTAK